MVLKWFGTSLLNGKRGPRSALVETETLICVCFVTLVSSELDANAHAHSTNVYTTIHSSSFIYILLLNLLAACFQVTRCRCITPITGDNCQLNSTLDDGPRMEAWPRAVANKIDPHPTLTELTETRHNICSGRSSQQNPPEYWSIYPEISWSIIPRKQSNSPEATSSI